MDLYVLNYFEIEKNKLWILVESYKLTELKKLIYYVLLYMICKSVSIIYIYCTNLSKTINS